MMRRLAPLAAAVALAACQQANAPEESETAAPATPGTAAAPAPLAETPAAASTSATPPHLTLAPLSRSDDAVITDAMENLGGCQFSDSDDRMLLSLGLPDSATQKGIAVARPGGRQAKLISEESGRTALEKGPTLSFEGVTIAVARGGGAGDKAGIETMVWPATLRVEDADGGSASYTGRWSCGV